MVIWDGDFMSEKQFNGYVTSFFRSRGFGFIRCEEIPEQEIYFSYTNICLPDGQFKVLPARQKVVFTVQQGTDGRLYAAEVTPIIDINEKTQKEIVRISITKYDKWLSVSKFEWTTSSRFHSGIQYLYFDIPGYIIGMSTDPNKYPDTDYLKIIDKWKLVGQDNRRKNLSDDNLPFDLYFL